mmetsp:Transcript_45556/g.103134  ORF Transcript_45556/g.103134 Transcript_45556/m.103134 type:complete len:250 (+) Transcript_45556:979-1728(+)
MLRHLVALQDDVNNEDIIDLEDPLVGVAAQPLPDIIKVIGKRNVDQDRCSHRDPDNELDKLGAKLLEDPIIEEQHHHSGDDQGRQPAPRDVPESLPRLQSRRLMLMAVQIGWTPQWHQRGWLIRPQPQASMNMVKPPRKPRPELSFTADSVVSQVERIKDRCSVGAWEYYRRPWGVSCGVKQNIAFMVNGGGVPCRAGLQHERSNRGRMKHKKRRHEDGSPCSLAAKPEVWAKSEAHREGPDGMKGRHI